MYVGVSVHYMRFDRCLQADKSYTASAVLDGAELSYFGQEGLSEVSTYRTSFCSLESNLLTSRQDATTKLSQLESAKEKNPPSVVKIEFLVI